MKTQRKDPVIIFGADDKSRYEAAIRTGGNSSQDAGSGKMRLLSALEFTEKMIGAIKNGELSKFRKTFKDIDVLVVRDIENMAGKETTQDEILEIFRSLFLNGKQIILTLYDDPGKVKGFFPPLRSFLKMAMRMDLTSVN